MATTATQDPFAATGGGVRPLRRAWIGQRFGRLVVTARASNSPSGMPRFVAACDCGATTTVYGRNLRAGDTTSCGCFRRESAHSRTHGESRSVLHLLWKRIKQRCHDTNAHNFKWYGGRGIQVAEKWRHDYVAFRDDILASIGPPPLGMSLDRIDNDGNYAPGNVRWATQSQQFANSRGAKKGEA